MRYRKTRAALLAAFLPINPFSAFRLTDGGDAGGDGSGGDDDKKKAAGGGKGKKKDDTGGDASDGDKGATGEAKITISEADLKARTEKAAADAVAAHEKKLKAEREKADREQKKKDGDIQALYESEQARGKELETENAALKVENQKLRVSQVLQAHLIESQPDYLKSSKYILSMVQFDEKTTPEDIEKGVKAAVAEFVKDNPRASDKKQTGGAPGSGTRGKSTAGNGDGDGGGSKPDATKRAVAPRDTPAGAYLRGW